MASAGPSPAHRKRARPASAAGNAASVAQSLPPPAPPSVPLLPAEQRLRIAMVSDFFLPNMGGIETHIYHLSVCLIERGHKVIVVTHCYDERVGIRYLTRGLKVYYLPNLPFYNQSTFPTFYASLPLLREIFIRERIQIVHGHQEFGALGVEACVHAGVLGLHTCYTNHSLFGFSDASAFLMNQFAGFVQRNLDHVICVSNTSKENQVLRAGLSPERVSVVPNAVETSLFLPAEKPPPLDRVNIVVVSRLVYRKGVDLLIGVLPLVCARVPNAHFIIGGDGNKRVELEEMIERHQLNNRVEFLGELPMHKVPDALRRGHLFLNCSLTEAFCMAIVEAVSCGLLVVSTSVGGIPEVLPAEMVILTEPTSEALAAGVVAAIPRLASIDRHALHRSVSAMYNWPDVALRVERIYSQMLLEPPRTVAERLQDAAKLGFWRGVFFGSIIAGDSIGSELLEWWRPAKAIELAEDFTAEDRQKL